jgi:hypothetical protein
MRSLIKIEFGWGSMRFIGDYSSKEISDISGQSTTKNQNYIIFKQEFLNFFLWRELKQYAYYSPFI